MVNGICVVSKQIIVVRIADVVVIQRIHKIRLMACRVVSITVQCIQVAIQIIGIIIMVERTWSSIECREGVGNTFATPLINSFGISRIR